MSILILIFLLSMFLGMREVSAALSNPFGDDDVDLPVGKMIRDLRKLISPLVQETLGEPPHAAAPRRDHCRRRRPRRRRRRRRRARARRRRRRANQGRRAATQAGSRRRACSSSARSPRTRFPPTRAARHLADRRRWAPAQTLPPLYVAATQAGPDGGIDGIHAGARALHSEYMKGLAPLRQPQGAGGGQIRLPLLISRLDSAPEALDGRRTWGPCSRDVRVHSATSPPMSAVNRGGDGSWPSSS